MDLCQKHSTCTWNYQSFNPPLRKKDQARMAQEKNIVAGIRFFWPTFRPVQVGLPNTSSAGSCPPAIGGLVIPPPDTEDCSAVAEREREREQAMFDSIIAGAGLVRSFATVFVSLRMCSSRVLLQCRARSDILLGALPQPLPSGGVEQ